MEKNNRDKYLAEELGLCWHENLPYKNEGTILAGYECNNCRTLFQGLNKEDAFLRMGKNNPNFSTWKYFGQLWKFAIEQRWWNDFLIKNKVAYEDSEQSERFMRYKFNIFSLIDPDMLADNLYSYLKNMKNK